MYRSAMGKMVDMSALEAKNEMVRAVGNMKVNARGDTIDSYGRVIKSNTEKVTERYTKTVGNRSAQPTKKPVQRPVIKEELTLEEQEINNGYEDDLAIEELKKRQIKK